MVDSNVSRAQTFVKYVQKISEGIYQMSQDIYQMFQTFVKSFQRHIFVLIFSRFSFCDGRLFSSFPGRGLTPTRYPLFPFMSQIILLKGGRRQDTSLETLDFIFHPAMPSPQTILDCFLRRCKINQFLNSVKKHWFQF